MGKKIILNISLIIIILSLNIVYADAVYPDYSGADAILILIVYGIYALLARLVSCYMNMEKKDRLAIFITSFITMIGIYFFKFSVMINHTRFFVNNKFFFNNNLIVGIFIPIIVEGIIYKNTLKYKKLNGWIVAIITHAIAIAGTLIIIIIFSHARFQIWSL